MQKYQTKHVGSTINMKYHVLRGLFEMLKSRGYVPPLRPPFLPLWFECMFGGFKVVAPLMQTTRFLFYKKVLLDLELKLLSTFS